jgi:hypothetical protein
MYKNQHKKDGVTTVNSKFLGSGIKYQKSSRTKVYPSSQFKTKENIGYILNHEGVISFFLIENHVLRKTIKKFKNFPEKTAVE